MRAPEGLEAAYRPPPAPYDLRETSEDAFVVLVVAQLFPSVVSDRLSSNRACGSPATGFRTVFTDSLSDVVRLLLFHRAFAAISEVLGSL